MAGIALRLIERLHGHLGALSIAALLHPAILLRRGSRRADLAVLFATILPTFTAALGVWLYGPYRDELKRPIFVADFAVGVSFERKEHLAFGAVLLAWAGAFSYLASLRGDGLGATRRASFVAFSCAFLLASVAAALGVWVSAHRTF